MSKHGWERGEIKLPSAEAVAFRHGMVEFFNQRQTRLFSDSVSLFKFIKAAGKGKRNFDYHEAARKHAVMTRSYGYGIGSDQVEGFDEMFDAIFPYEQNGRSRKPKAPKKKDFALAKLSAKGLPVGSEAGIEFKGSTVIWSVGENNHSVERAHEHAVGREFFKRLSRVKWTARSGGEIVGNDEYNRENTSSGGGGNYTTNRYGSADKQSLSAMRSWRS